MLKTEEIEQRVIDRINGEVSNDFKRLHRASIALEHYLGRVQFIEQKLNCASEETADPSRHDSNIHTALRFRAQASESLDIQMIKLEQFGVKLSKQIEDSASALKGATGDLDRVHRLRQLLQYLKIVQDIQEISAALQSAIKSKDDAKMVNIYLTLFEDNDDENSVVGRLQAVDAAFLKSFAQRTAIHWHEQLKDHLSKEFESTLKSMRWGSKEHDSLNYVPPADATSKAQLLAEYMFLVKSPVEEEDDFVTITPSIICYPISAVTTLLLAPYRQRFMYHFTGARQTNRLDKPEWYFTQILNWGKESHLFVGKTFQSSVVRAGKLDFNIRLEFIRGLVQLTIEKLVADIKEVSRDEVLFAHLLDETLAFEIELRETFGYPPSFPSAIDVITQPVYLLKWIALEERFCAEKMDAILQDPDAWHLIDASNLDDDFKIPKCADQFMRLLEAIKDRYYPLIQPGHQLQFLTLQLELIDNFRRRLVQLHSGNLVETIPILNAVNYITMVLREWGENIHYLHLHAALVGTNATELNSVFQQPVAEMEHWIDELVRSISTKTVNEIKAKSMPYRHNAWSTMPEQSCKEPYFLSPSAGEMFQVALTLLHKLESELSNNLFNAVLRSIAKHVDNFLYDTVVINAKFSPAGAAQFNYDMTRNLFTIFGQYTKRPDLLFKKISDSTKLLTAARGTALLLHEALLKDSSLEEKLKPLRELGIVNFKPKTCIEVLERRTDIRML